MDSDGPVGGAPRLRSLAMPARLLLTGLLLGAGAGFVAAQVNLRATHGMADGQPGLSVEDVRRVFSGRPGWSLLAAKVDGGTMERHVPVASEKEILVAWANGGARREEFAPAREVLERRCLKCHAPGKQKEDRPFTRSAEAGADWDLVRAYTIPDGGMTVAALARSTHAHLFGMSVLFVLLGAVYLMSDAGKRNQCVVVSLPFLAMFMDVGCWWLARVNPLFCWGIVVGGGLMAMAVAYEIGRPLWELWGPRPTGIRV